MLSEARILPIAEALVGDLAKNGNWVITNIRSNVPWPIKIQRMTFRGHEIYLVPKTTHYSPFDGGEMFMYPFAAVNMPSSTDFNQGKVLLSNFLRSLSWVENAGISVEHWTGGNHASPMGKVGQAEPVSDFIDLDYLPDPKDVKSRWALSFYREGLCLENSHIAYAFLSFFKIININAPNSKDQIKLLNTIASELIESPNINHRLKRRIEELLAYGNTDIGKYLYVSCRCAVAHAGTEPTIDPENPTDIERLYNDLPLIKAIAACAIEKSFGIKSRHTVFREHLYELDGFREFFGPTLVSKIINSNSIDDVNEIEIPVSDFSIRYKDPYSALANLRPLHARYENGVVQIVFESPGAYVRIEIRLYFSQ